MAHYAPLFCKSNFSFLEGASHPEELVEEAHRLGLQHLALTDRDGVYGMVRAYEKAKELDMHLVVGSEVSIEDGSSLVLIVKNREGYKNLCRLLTKGRLRCEKGTSRVLWTEVYEHACGLIALWGGAKSLLGRSAEPLFVASKLKEAFGENLYALLLRHFQDEDGSVEERTRARAIRLEIETLASTEVLYHHRSRQPLQDLLTCIRHGVTLQSAGTLLQPNAEHSLKSSHTMERIFSDVPRAVARTFELAATCEFSLGDLRYRYPSERLPSGMTSSEWLVQVTLEGARKRYGDELTEGVRAQLKKELELISELEFEGYFLTMWEIVRFCREQRILCQGRGSAANSIVCYCLGITAIDPIQMGLLFERFLSRERSFEPPDIDLDIAHERREEVIQHMYKKYGTTHAAMVANVIRYRAKSAVREVGKALGIPETSLSRLSKMLSHYDSLQTSSLEHAGFDLDNPVHNHLFRYASELVDFPRHLSIHPGGFLLGHEPVHDIVPIENATMEGRTVVQWDKDDLETLGLFKVDLLGLGALTQLDHCFHLLKRHRNVDLSLRTIPQDDKATYEMICRADTVGVFQIESRAQMAMLPRLQPRKFYDLVVEVSIVRPGPITGGMVHPYLRRRRNEEPVTYPHPSLEPVLEKTLGVPLFQEQVMRLAMVAADYTPGEADQLRRDMAAWRRSGRIESHRERLISRMQKKGIPLDFAERVFDQIRGFGEYGFPESHAASFALISYATSFLKCHHPVEFACALLNAQPMGFYSPATIVEDTKRHHITVLPIDVQKSVWDCSLEEPLDENGRFRLRMGARYVKGLARSEWDRIESNRLGEFETLDEFVRRTGVSNKTLSRLAEAGALSSFNENRRTALWHGQTIVHGQSALGLASAASLPDFAPLSAAEEVAWDYRTTYHSPRGHPLRALRRELHRQGFPDARTLQTLPDDARVRYAGLVICRQRPGTASGVTFMTLEDETGFVNLVIWKAVFEKYVVLAKATAFLGVEGRVQSKDGVVHLIAESLFAPEVRSMPHAVSSRDFH